MRFTFARNLRRPQSGYRLGLHFIRARRRYYSDGREVLWH